MYHVFNPFLWETDHHKEKRADRKKFNEALAKVIEEPTFDPNAMGEYMAEELGIVLGATNNPRTRIVTRSIQNARAVKEYLEDQ